MFARSTPYGTRAAHGPLVFAMELGLISRLGLADGTSLGFLSVKTWRLLLPVKAGDTITVVFKFIEKRKTARFGRRVLKPVVRVVNQDTETVQDGVMATMVKSRADVAAPQ